jgi:hypothetical protein
MGGQLVDGVGGLSKWTVPRDDDRENLALFDHG